MRTEGADRLGPAMLFCPADRADRVRKAAGIADNFIVDLEDAVAPAARAEARASLGAVQAHSDRGIVRINAAGTEDHRRDLDAIGRTTFNRVMLAKTESVEQVEELSGLSVVALVETARGLMELPKIMRARNLVAVMWGSEDLTVSLGGWSSRKSDGQYRDVIAAARSSVLTAAAASGVPAIDTVYLNLRDDVGLRQEALDAAESGFSAKACLHPRQVDVVRTSFLPDARRIRWAEEILAQNTAAAATDANGQFVDEPVIEQARRVLQATKSRQPLG